MDAKTRQADVVDFLKKSYLGPQYGQNELLKNRPDRTYLVGTLFPQDNTILDGDATRSDEEDEASVPSSDDPTIETANAWKPSSASISFIHDGDSIECSLSFGTYSLEQEKTGQTGWRRQPHGLLVFQLSEKNREWIPNLTSSYNVRVTSRWRKFGDRLLVTVSISNQQVSIDEDGNHRTEDALFQVQMNVRAVGGSIHPYETTTELNLDDEEQELAVRYRDKKAFAVGHGTSVDWTDPALGDVSVRINPLPQYTVPVISARVSKQQVFNLDYLASLEVDTSHVIESLSNFINDYDTWIQNQESIVREIDSVYVSAARRLLLRQNAASIRMRQGIQTLRDVPDARRAFSLAMVAMRDQMIQSSLLQHLSEGQSDGDDVHVPAEPTWRPFQLGFILTSLSSLLDSGHSDRELVDLIWFPTGGGKTEAYLGLAAIEIFWRRIKRGSKGAGTAVLTRYTLRLLTTQQFERAATLICAMELLRFKDARVRGMAPFSIGLWVGNETTPGTDSVAISRFEETLKKQRPDNPFQLQNCPWCGHRIMPLQKSLNIQDYGARIQGGTVVLCCPSQQCPFTAELPIEVIDERIYRNPPTVLLATVDKFARLAHVPEAGSLLGRVGFDPPSLIIQDELHLLSGPLGTTVGIFDSAVIGIIESCGVNPKIVASTATIRAAEVQVRGLMARSLSLFPPSGINEDDSYFAVPDVQAPGRTYIGLMPQAFTQATSVVRGMTPMLEAPYAIASAGAEDRDAYWTVVAYHNSLRELGRTVTLVRDDIHSLLTARSSVAKETRDLRSDGLVELTGQVAADDLPRTLSRLATTSSHPDAVDVVASTNMLSVGIDVSRLGAMFMNGQPKTNSEYIQATSRVGRGAVPGIVVTLYRAGRPRDRSHYETFRSFHEALYRHVEPTSVTPWSLASRTRTLSSALVAFVRHTTPYGSNESASEFRRDSVPVRRVVDRILRIVEFADAQESAETKIMLDRLLREWEHLATAPSEINDKLYYREPKKLSLIKSFGDSGPGWPTINSMRNVDKQVGISIARERGAK